MNCLHLFQAAVQTSAGATIERCGRHQRSYCILARTTLHGSDYRPDNYNFTTAAGSCRSSTSSSGSSSNNSIPFASSSIVRSSYNVYCESRHKIWFHHHSGVGGRSFDLNEGNQNLQKQQKHQQQRAKRRRQVDCTSITNGITSNNVSWYSTSAVKSTRGPLVLAPTSLALSFHVAKIRYSDGNIEFMHLPASELLQQYPSVYARDLFALNLTASTAETTEQDSSDDKYRDNNNNRNRNGTAAMQSQLSPTSTGSTSSSASYRRPASLLKPSSSSTSSLNSSYALASIVPRNKEAIVVSFGVVRAVATVDTVLIFETQDPAVSELATEIAKTYSYLSLSNNHNHNHHTDTTTTLNTPTENYHYQQNQHNDQNDDISYHNTDTNNILQYQYNHREPNELIFLEYVIRDAVESYNRRLRLLYEPICDKILDQVSYSNNINIKNINVHRNNNNNSGMHHFNYKDDDGGIWVVRMLGPLKDSLHSFEIEVKQSLDCLSELLTNDDSMLALLLTEQRIANQSGKVIDFVRHEHVELLIGQYARHINNTLMEINHLLGRIRSKQELVSLTLASYRNRLVMMNVHLSITALAVSFSTAIAGFCGMNIPNGLEQSMTAFPILVFASCAGSVFIGIGCHRYITSNRTMQIAATKRMEQIDTLTNALSDMSALDYALKTSAFNDSNAYSIVDKSTFRTILQRARARSNFNNSDGAATTSSHNSTGNTNNSSTSTNLVSDGEVDLLFDIFDRVKDGKITLDDFHGINDLQEWKSGGGVGHGDRRLE